MLFNKRVLPMLRGIRAAHAVTSKTFSMVTAKCVGRFYHFGSGASTETDSAALLYPARQKHRQLIILKHPNDQTNQHNLSTTQMNIFHINFNMISYEKSTRMSVDYQQSTPSLPFVHAVPINHRTEKIDKMKALMDDKVQLVLPDILSRNCDSNVISELLRVTTVHHQINTPPVGQDRIQSQQLNGSMSLKSISSLILPTPSDYYYYYCMNRNARRGKRANKGKRPCSRQHQRKRRRRFGSHRR